MNMNKEIIISLLGTLYFTGCATTQNGYVPHQSLCAQTQSNLLLLEAQPAKSLNLTERQYAELRANSPYCKELIEKSRQDYIKAYHLDSEGEALLSEGQAINREGDRILMKPMMN